MSASFDIPMDLIYSILEKLPVSTLLRFERVSKSWRALIKSSEFIKSHLNHSVETNSISSSRLLFVPLSGTKVFDQLSLCRTDECLKISLSYKFRLPFRFRENHYKIIGSCNGLICFLFFETKRLALFNVSTRLFRPMPVIPDRNTNSIKGFTMYGFGYDCRSEDYKIVIFYRENLIVYSLKTDSWKFIKRSRRYIINSHYNSILVKNRLHWIASGYRILSFDLHDEEVRQVPLPICDDGPRRVTRIGVLDGCLCANIYNTSGSIGIWMMREYNNVESWVKAYSCLSKTIPLREFKEGLIFSKDSGLFVWNPQSKKTKIEKPQGVGVGEGAVMHEAVEYIESLVPLRPDSYALATIPRTTPRHPRKKKRIV